MAHSDAVRKVPMPVAEQSRQNESMIRSGDLPRPEYPWKGKHRIGAKLMIDQGLPRDENRDPYQTCFWFDEDGPIVLVRDTDGTPLGWESTSSSDPKEWGLCRLPAAIVAAAEEAER